MSKAKSPSILKVEAVRARQRGLPIPVAWTPPAQADSAAADVDPAPRLEKFLTLHEVIAATGQSKPVIYRKMRAGTFPKQIRLETKPGAQRSIAVWIESEIVAWQQSQIRKRDAA
jgi:prophage regulatory protein